MLHPSKSIRNASSTVLFVYTSSATHNTSMILTATNSIYKTSLNKFRRTDSEEITWQN